MLAMDAGLYTSPCTSLGTDVNAWPRPTARAPTGMVRKLKLEVPL